MEGRRLYIRLLAMAALVTTLAFVVVARLYDLQILNGASYYLQSEKKISRSVEITAARGEILDRYGRRLVTNRLCYNLAFDAKLFPADRRNEIISGLIGLCGETGTEYTDTLPIEVYGGSAVYVESSGTASQRLEAWKEAMDCAVDISAESLFALMREEYGIEETLTDAEARPIAGVRWELDLRTARIGLNIPSYVFARDVSTGLIAAIKERDMPGVEVLTETVRQYETDYAAHLLGRVGAIPEGSYAEYKEQGYALDDAVGLDGAEKAFETWLRGENGLKIETRSSDGKVTGVMYEEAARAGSNIMLTIDIRLQEAAERSLQSRIEEIRALGEQGSSQGAADAAGGAVVVIDVNTFEVLASASYPTYQLSGFNRDYSALLADELTPMVNRAFTGKYPPGSTFKMATAIAALESGAITKDTRITDLGIYSYYAPSYTPMCEVYLNSRSTHGTINVVDALRVSCNYFFYETGRLTGIDKMNQYAKLLGLGQSTGIELGEATGLLAGRESREAAGGVWNPGDTIAAAIGQSDNLFTPLQMACYTAVIANGGTRYAAHILKTVKTYDYSDTVYDSRPAVLSSLGASENTMDTVRRGMLAVSTSGSSSAVFARYAVQVASKTGTAQTGRGSPTGVFVAFAPYDDPQVAVAVVVEHAGKGSRIGTIARDVLDSYFRSDQSLNEITVENTLVN